MTPEVATGPTVASVTTIGSQQHTLHDVELPAYGREYFDDVAFMTSMVLTLLGNYRGSGHFGGPLAYTPYNVALHLAGAGAGWLWAAASEASRVDDATTALQREDRAATRNTRVLSYVITAILAGLDAYVDAHLDGFEVDTDPFANLGARLSVRF